MKNIREIPRVAPTDQTAFDLKFAGWRNEGGVWQGLWYDPRTGIGWSISQAASILADRRTPQYRFK